MKKERQNHVCPSSIFAIHPIILRRLACLAKPDARNDPVQKSASHVFANKKAAPGVIVSPDTV